MCVAVRVQMTINYVKPSNEHIFSFFLYKYQELSGFYTFIFQKTLTALAVTECYLYITTTVIKVNYFV